MPVPEPGQRWGVLGGTFDPVHNGHLNLARQISYLEALAGVFFIPAWEHPLKDKPLLTEYHHRVAMLKLAIDHDGEFVICEIEKEERLSGYTIDTLQALRKRFRGTELYFIIGMDNLERISHWHEPEKILDEVRMLVGNRPGFERIIPKDLPANRIRLVYTDDVSVSSTEIREALTGSEDDSRLSQLTPASVVKYIRENGLYQ